jgi:predicted aconitase with swiveling domain
MPEGRTLVAGRAAGPALVLTEPLSFWGGFDVTTGRIIDRQHPQRGACLSGAIVVMPAGRGSSSAPSVLAEAIRLGTAPAGIVLAEADMIVALGAVVADELYGRACPVVVLPPDAYAALRDDDALTIAADDERATVAMGGETDG